MDPIPPTAEAIEKLDRFGGPSVDEALRAVSDRVGALVPSLLGLSLTLVEEGITLTMVASSAELLELDAFQYLDGGPCVHVTEDSPSTLAVNETDPTSEWRWSRFARASAAHGVKSSLSLALWDGERVVGGVNLYACTKDAFEGQVDEIAQTLHAESIGAIHDADLSFSTRLVAADAPQVLADRAVVDVACGMLAAEQQVPVETARDQLRDAAARAGVSQVVLAKGIIRDHTDNH
jgi:GAF domain-containing protein